MHFHIRISALIVVLERRQHGQLQPLEALCSNGSCCWSVRHADDWCWHGRLQFEHVWTIGDSLVPSWVLLIPTFSEPHPPELFISGSHSWLRRFSTRTRRRWKMWNRQEFGIISPMVKNWPTGRRLQSMCIIIGCLCSWEEAPFPPSSRLLEGAWKRQVRARSSSSLAVTRTEMQKVLYIWTMEKYSIMSTVNFWTEWSSSQTGKSRLNSLSHE